MNDVTRPTATMRGIRRLLAVFGTAAVIAVAVFVSRSSLEPTATLAADEPKTKEKEKKPAPTPKAVEAATAFLDSLDAKVREKAVYEYDSDKKPKWSNFPVGMTPRNGVKLGDLSKEQREKAMAVVAAVLSKDGYQKVIDIMDGDQKLTEGQGGGRGPGGPGGGPGGPGGGGAMFGKDLYYLAIFGTPSESKPWMVQFGGHHLGVNVTVVGKLFILTPTHTGSQPALFKRDGKEVRPLGVESDTAYKLLTELDDKQRKQAVIGDRAQNLILGPGQDGKKVEAKGVKGSDLTKEQQSTLLELIGAWVNITESEAATARMAAIKEKIADTHFAWSGPTDKPGTGYFRVQGPTVVIEYAPQGGTDHVHTVIRSPDDDYGVGSAKK